MKKQGTGIRDQGSVARLLRLALEPIEERAETSHDLWPAMLRKLHAESLRERAKVRVPWFDWALAGGLALLLAAFPTAIPLLLYYL